MTRYSIDEATPDEWDIVARKWKLKQRQTDSDL